MKRHNHQWQASDGKKQTQPRLEMDGQSFWEVCKFVAKMLKFDGAVKQNFLHRLTKRQGVTNLYEGLFMWCALQFTWWCCMQLFGMIFWGSWFLGCKSDLAGEIWIAPWTCHCQPLVASLQNCPSGCFSPVEWMFCEGGGTFWEGTRQQSKMHVLEVKHQHLNNTFLSYLLPSVCMALCQIHQRCSRLPCWGLFTSCIFVHMFPLHPHKQNMFLIMFFGESASFRWFCQVQCFHFACSVLARRFVCFRLPVTFGLYVCFCLFVYLSANMFFAALSIFSWQSVCSLMNYVVCLFLCHCPLGIKHPLRARQSICQPVSHQSPCVLPPAKHFCRFYKCQSPMQRFVCLFDPLKHVSMYSWTFSQFFCQCARPYLCQETILLVSAQISRRRSIALTC